MEYPGFSEKLWSILQLIPRSKLIQSQVEAALSHHFSWEDLLSKKNTYKLFYILQILKDLLHSEAHQAAKVDFISNGGLQHISQLIHINRDALEIYSMYHHAYLLSMASPKQKHELNRLISLKDTLRDEDPQTSYFGVSSNAMSSSSNSSNLTPTFNSPGTTPPFTPPQEQ